MMKYVGSKNKLSKYLVPIIQSFINAETTGYIEPFVGGANMIDKINHKNRIGYDIHLELIDLLNYAKYNQVMIPPYITKQEYIEVRDNKDKYPSWYVGLVGFCGSYNAKYFGGYAGECVTKDGVRHYDEESIRNLKKQSECFNDITFIHSSFCKLIPSMHKNYVFYCDIPYRDTTSYKTESFPYDEFYKWAIEMSEHNTVLISEYSMPNDKFECIWSKEHKTSLDNSDNQKKRVEKLFIVKRGVTNADI